MVGSAGTGVAGGAGRAKLSTRGQWSLRVGKASLAETVVTQGAAAYEAMA